MDNTYDQFHEARFLDYNDNDLNQFRNSNYMRSVIHAYKNDKYLTKKKNRQGFHLITNDISEILFICDTIFFKKNDSLHVYGKKIDARRMVVAKNLGISVVACGNKKIITK